MTTPTTVQVRFQFRADTAANWTTIDPVLLANELGRESDTGKIKIGTGSDAWSSLPYQDWSSLANYPLLDADIASNAEIAVSKLANGTANQILTTDGTDVSWTDSPTIAGNVIIEGNLTVNGTETIINVDILRVEDKTIEMGNVVSPSDLTADGGGIVLKGSSDKTILWVDSTDSWTSSENFDLASGKTYKIAGTDVLSATTLGSGVTGSSLTSVGNLTDLTVDTDTLYVDATNDRVGVNTASPDATLHALIGTFGKSWTPPTGTSALFERNSINYVTIAAANNNTSQLNFADTDDADIGNIKYSHANDSLTFGVNNSDRLVIDSSGRLLVGATSFTGPTKLVVRGNSSASTGSGNAYLVRGESSADMADNDIVGLIRFSDQDNNRCAEIRSSIDGTPSASASPGDLSFWTTAASATTPTQRMTIDSSGNVGIGEANPSRQLVVNGGASSSYIQICNTNSGTTSSDGFQLKMDSAGAIADIINRENGDMRFFTNNDQKMVIDSSGRLLVGTASSSFNTRFIVKNNATSSGPGSVCIGTTTTSPTNGATIGANIYLSSADNNIGEIRARRDGGTWTNGTSHPSRLEFSTTEDGLSSPTIRMTIKSSGNVGVNSVDPKTNLHVHNDSTTGFSVADNTDFSGIGILIESSTAAGDGNYGAALAWTRPGADTYFKTAIAPVQEGTDVDVQGLAFFTSNGPFATSDPIERVRIDSSGNVGIGTVSSGSLLHLSSSNDTALTIADTSVADTHEQVVLMNNGGNFNIRTHEADGTFKSIDYIINKGASGATSHVWRIENSERARIDSSGNVGIGQVSPAQLLDVNGDALINGLTIGKGAGSLTGNTAIGENVLANATTGGDGGDYNTGVGLDVLTDLTTGGDNTALGGRAGRRITTGSTNTFVGRTSGNNLTTGDNNTGLGAYALEDSTTGNNNTALGYQALNNSVGGNNGVALGLQAQFYYNNTSTSHSNTNTAVGYQTLRGSTTPADNTGLGNVAVGYQVMYDNTSGTNNTAVGTTALGNNTSGLSNVAIGASSLLANTTGSSNVAVGNLALYTSTVVDQCTAIGFEAQRFSDSTTTNKDGNNTSVGFRALRGSNNAANNTGINNTAVGYNTLILNSSGHSNTALGTAALSTNTTGHENVAVGVNALVRNTGSAENTAIGYNAGRYEQDGSDDANFSNCTYLGHETRASGSNQVQLGDATTTTYAYGAVQDRSDERDKADIRDTVIGLDFINTLRPVDFRWDMRDDYFDTEIYEEEETETVEVPNPAYVKDGDEPQYIEETITKMVTKDRLVPVTKDGSRKRNRFHHGLIAQEVKAAADAAGVDFAGYQDHSVGGGKDVLTLGYSELIAPLIKAVQELSAENAALKARLDALEGV